jgi:hypothetical protein
MPRQAAALRAPQPRSTPRHWPCKQHKAPSVQVSTVEISQPPKVTATCGGALGAYKAGVVEALSERLLSENTRRPLFDIIAGTCSGAINAALVVSYFKDKRTWNGAAEKLTRYWKDGSLGLGAQIDFWIRSWQEEHKDDPSGASYEAARRYYSAKYLLQNGASRIFPKPQMVLDDKFFDTGSTFPNNIWFRDDKGLLRKNIENLGFPIATSYEKGEPGLLVVSTNVKGDVFMQKRCDWHGLHGHVIGALPALREELPCAQPSLADPLDISPQHGVRDPSRESYEAVCSPWPEVFFKVFGSPREPLAKVKQDCSVFIAEKDLVASHLIYYAVKCDLGRQMLVKDGWLFIRLIE